MTVLSASQIGTYRDECQRKWALKSIAKKATEQHASAKLGTEVDDEQLQPYLKSGRTFDYSRASQSGYIAASALGFLPPPMSHGLEVQKHFTMPSPTKDSGLSYQGYIDLWMPKGGMILPDGFESTFPVVCDFKTTGNLKWAKSAEALKTDVQAQLYATYAMYATGSRTVDLVWLYMQTKGTKKTKRTHLRVHGDHVGAQLRAIDAIGVEMQHKRLLLEASANGPEDLEAAILRELPANPEACEGYGGCPFRGVCNLSPSVFTDIETTKVLAEMETDMSGTATTTMGLLAEMKAKKARDAAAAGAAPQASAVRFGTPPPVTDADRDEAAARVAALIAEGDAPPAFAGINPPESTLPPAPAVGSVFVHEAPTAVVLTEKRKPGRPRKDPLGADAAVHTATPSAPAEVPSPSVDTLTGITVITVVWGEETICSVPYNSFKVGPFSVTVEIHGESVTDAQARVYADLVTFAEEQRLAKAVSHAAFLTALGVSR